MNLLLLTLLAAVPAGEDQPVTTPLTGPASARFAMPVSITFDPALPGDTTLVKDDGSTRAGTTPDAVAAIARSAPAVARRHFARQGAGAGKVGRVGDVRRRKGADQAQHRKARPDDEGGAARHRAARLAVHQAMAAIATSPATVHQLLPAGG